MNLHAMACRFIAGALALVLFLFFGGDIFAQDALALARKRHQDPDPSLTDYRSQINTLVSIGLVTSRLEPPQLMLAAELASRVAWDRAQGLQVRMIGQRYVTSQDLPVEDDDVGVDFEKPWFVATIPGDSLRVLGALELPGRAAVHPFARGAERYYHYALGDTITLSIPPGAIDLVEVRVTPTRGDEALVVGSLWVDASTGAIAAMQIRFVGRPLWSDQDHPEGSDWANRILSLSATIEQGFWEGRYWLPRRQTVELMIDVPFFGSLAFPLVFNNEFGRYRVNTGEPIAWLGPDSIRHAEEEPEEGAVIDVGDTEDEGRQTTRVRAGTHAGQEWEIIRPPDDSLSAYADWRDPLEAPSDRLRLPDAEDLERRARGLDPDIVGRKLFVVGQVDRLAELIRYNRVESLGVGIGFNAEIPRRPFWAVSGLAGFGVADLEPKGRLGLRYDPPRARLRLDGFSELHIAGSVLTDDTRAYGNALRAFFLGRDDADYYRASGISLVAGRRRGAVSLRAGAAAEYHQSVKRNTDVAVTAIWEDSVFPPNPPATEGWFGRVDAAFTWFAHTNWSRPGDRAELSLGVEAGTGESLDYVQPRLGFDLKFSLGTIARLAAIGAGGWTAGDAPLQRQWRIGGLNTVRGYLHGTRRGESYWTGRIELSRRGRRVSLIQPVLFADVGWAGAVEDWPGGGASGDVLWSPGLGASFLNGLVRTDLVFPELDDVSFEFYFAGAL